MGIKTYKRGSRQKLSANFSAYEFDCHGAGCCEETLIDDQLVALLQKISDAFDNVPVTVTGPYRCPTHNAETPNASKTSLHMRGMAADIVVDGVAPIEVAKCAERIGVLGIGLYDGFVHVDTRTVKSFWRGHAQVKCTTFGATSENTDNATVQRPTDIRKTYDMKLPLLQKGCTGSDVKALQQLLIANGCDCGEWADDGDFGAGTDSALRSYQEKNNLGVDGKAGPEVWSHILGLQ